MEYLLIIRSIHHLFITSVSPFILLWKYWKFKHILFVIMPVCLPYPCTYVPCEGCIFLCVINIGYIYKICANKMLEFACSWQVCQAKACLLRMNACCFYRWWTGRGRSIDYSQRGGCRCVYLYSKQQHRFLELARAATLSNGRTLLPQVRGFVKTQLSLLQD